MDLLVFIKQPWPWYVAGPLIGLTVPVLLLLGNKPFGISSVLRHACAMVLPANISFFKYRWQEGIWNLVFVLGIFLGGIIASQTLLNPEPIVIASSLREELVSYGITEIHGLVPEQLFSWSSFFSIKGFLALAVGGFLVGFGTRYAGGCTSGHAISGLSNLQVPSLIATVCFMMGGFIMANLIVPFIFSL